MLLGAILAFALVNSLSSALGYLLFSLLPIQALRLASGVVFILTGAISLALPAREKGDNEAKAAGGHPPSLLNSFALVSLAELGDKTQLATMSFSALTGFAPVVALAAISALAAMTAITCALGSELARKIHGKAAKVIPSLVFMAVGIAMLLLPW